MCFFYNQSNILYWFLKIWFVAMDHLSYQYWYISCIGQFHNIGLSVSVHYILANISIFLKYFF